MWGVRTSWAACGLVVFVTGYPPALLPSGAQSQRSSVAKTADSNNAQAIPLWRMMTDLKT